MMPKGNKVGYYVVATVTVTIKNFKGTAAASALTAKSKITAAILKADYIKLKENSFSNNGKPVTPDFDVVIDGKVINPAYYTGSFTNNINAGTATRPIKVPRIPRLVKISGAISRIFLCT